jgi:hypothetical protein
MSSNMYGFEVNFVWEGRDCQAQFVYNGTFENEPSSLDYATKDWESTNPIDLAKYELEHRDWNKKYHADIRIGAYGIYSFCNDDDPSDFDWIPPHPTEKEVLQIIADGKAKEIREGWDT